MPVGGTGLTVVYKYEFKGRGCPIFFPELERYVSSFKYEILHKDSLLKIYYDPNYKFLALLGPIYKDLCASLILGDENMTYFSMQRKSDQSAMIRQLQEYQGQKTYGAWSQQILQKRLKKSHILWLSHTLQQTACY